MAAASLVDAPWSWHLQCPAVSITMSSLSSQLHALASRALLCRASELPHVAGPQRLVGIFTQASWTPFTTRSLLRPFLVQAVFKKLSRWVLLSQRLPCYPVRNRWLLTGSTLWMAPHLPSPVPLLYMRLSLTTNADRSISPATTLFPGHRQHTTRLFTFMSHR